MLHPKRGVSKKKKKARKKIAEGSRSAHRSNPNFFCVPIAYTFRLPFCARVVPHEKKNLIKKKIISLILIDLWDGFAACYSHQELLHPRCDAQI